MTEDALERKVERASAWRKKEIATAKLEVGKFGDDPVGAVLRRAMVPLVYGHWEGFFRDATQGLLDKRCTEEGFWDRSFGRRLFVNSKRVHDLAVGGVYGLIALAAQCPEREGRINADLGVFFPKGISPDLTVTKSVLVCLGVRLGSDLELKISEIDKLVRGARNQIADGEGLLVDLASFDLACDLVVHAIELLRLEICQ